MKIKFNVQKFLADMEKAAALIEKSAELEKEISASRDEGKKSNNPTQ